LDNVPWVYKPIRPGHTHVNFFSFRHAHLLSRFLLSENLSVPINFVLAVNGFGMAYCPISRFIFNFRIESCKLKKPLKLIGLQKTLGVLVVG